MRGVNCLRDLKKILEAAGHKTYEDEGWFFTTGHGKWDMAFDVVFLNNQPIHDISKLPKVAGKHVPKKPETLAETKTHHVDTKAATKAASKTKPAAKAEKVNTKAAKVPKKNAGKRTTKGK